MLRVYIYYSFLFPKCNEMGKPGVKGQKSLAKCGNPSHSTVIRKQSSEQPVKLQSLASRKIKKSVIHLYFPGVNPKLLPRYLCSTCVTHAEKVVGTPKLTKNEPSTSSDQVAEMEVDESTCNDAETL